MKTKQRTANEATVIGLEFKLGFAPVSFFRSPFSSGGGGGGVLNRVLCGEAPPRGPTPYPFSIPFLTQWYPFSIPSLELCMYPF